MPAKTFLAILLLTMAHFFCMKTLCLIKSTKNMLLQKTGTTDSINEAPFFFFLFFFAFQYILFQLSEKLISYTKGTESRCIYS